MHLVFPKKLDETVAHIVIHFWGPADKSHLNVLVVHNPNQLGLIETRLQNRYILWMLSFTHSNEQLEQLYVVLCTESVCKRNNVESE